MAHVIDKQITEYLPLLGKEEKKNILGFIKSYLKIKEKPQSISIEEYNNDIDKAMKRIDAGEFTTQEDLEIEAATW